jgi:hypothetical protein
MVSSYLTYATGGLALMLVLVVVLMHERSAHIKEWMVGAGAGLDFAQIAHVHVFTIAVVFWFLTSGGVAWRNVSTTAVALLLSAVTLAATAYIGPLAVNHTLMLQLIALASSAVIIGVKATPEATLRMTKGLLAVTLFSACWAILQKLGLVPIGHFNKYEAAGRVMGIYGEPDWLGLFCSVGIVTTLRLDLRRLYKITSISILGLALLFSLARTSIVALGVVAVVAVIANRLIRSDMARRSRNRQVLVVFACIVSMILVLSPSLSNRMLTRFQTGFTSSGQDVAARARTLQVESLSLLARRAPWYGDGLSAAGRVQVSGRIIYGTVPASDAVSTDWVLGWWVDGHYLALPLIAILCLLALRSITRFSGQLLLLVLVTSLVSDAVMLPITWFAIGLCLVRTTPAEKTKQAEKAKQALKPVRESPSRRLAPT